MSRSFQTNPTAWQKIGHRTAGDEMAIDFLYISCAIEGCSGEVVWVVSDDQNFDITCPKCGKTYALKVGE